MRGGSFPVFKPVLIPPNLFYKGILTSFQTIRYFNVVSDYLKLFRDVVSKIQVKIICRCFYFEQVFPFNTCIPCFIVLLLFLLILPSSIPMVVIVENS